MLPVRTREEVRSRVEETSFREHVNHEHIASRNITDKGASSENLEGN